MIQSVGGVRSERGSCDQNWGGGVRSERGSCDPECGGRACIHTNCQSLVHTHAYISASTQVHLHLHPHTHTNTHTQTHTRTHIVQKSQPLCTHGRSKTLPELPLDTSVFESCAVCICMSTRVDAFTETPQLLFTKTRKRVFTLVTRASKN